MNDTPSQGIVATALRALAGNRWVQVLAFLFVAFEIYNTAVLPAIRGTFDAMKARSEADIAKANAAAATSVYRSPSSGSPASADPLDTIDVKTLPRRQPAGEPGAEPAYKKWETK